MSGCKYTRDQKTGQIRKTFPNGVIQYFHTWNEALNYKYGESEFDPKPVHAGEGGQEGDGPYRCDVMVKVRELRAARAPDEPHGYEAECVALDGRTLKDDEREWDRGYHTHMKFGGHYGR